VLYRDQGAIPFDAGRPLELRLLCQRLRQLEDENHRLKKLVADLSLDKDILKVVISKNGWGS